MSLEMERFVSLKRGAFLVVACRSMLQMQKSPGENGIFLRLCRKSNQATCAIEIISSISLKKRQEEMIVTDKFVFVHLPRSGGTFVTRVIRKFFPGAHEIGHHLPREFLPRE